MARAYFTLVTRDAATDPWSIQFGDYDRECVESERDDMCQSYGSRHVAKKNTKIVKTADAKQATIVAAVAKLNGA